MQWQAIGALALACALAAPLPAFAVEPSCTPVADPARRWTPPLDRGVAVTARDISLRDALAQLAAAADVRFSYSADVVPLDRRVCVVGEGVSLGDALAHVLRGLPLEAVVAAPRQIALTPVAVARAGGAPAEMAQAVYPLERVVVTGNVVASPERTLPVATDVLDVTALRERGSPGAAGTFNGAVPGMWLWDQSPASVLAHYGSIRGASSFGVTHPKVYVDGIEVANPLLLTRFSPDLIARIEVIRGPQGAALYGADAISGVVNIVTNVAPAPGETREVTLRTSAGAAQSAFRAGGATLVQDHALLLRAGGPLRSASLAVSGEQVGDFIPGASSRQLSVQGGARALLPRASLTGMARLHAVDAGVVTSPLLDGLSIAANQAARDSAAGEPVDLHAPQRVRQYTVGGTATVSGGDRWTHTLIAGADGYRLANVVSSVGPLVTPLDSALFAARGGADRATLRASSVLELPAAGLLSSSVTVGAEHAELREETAMTSVPEGMPGRRGRAAGTSGARLVERWQRNSGVLAQMNASLGGVAHLTGGVRLERTAALEGGHRTDALPMFGVALVRDSADVTVKLRAAYGKGIRAPHTLGRGVTALSAAPGWLHGGGGGRGLAPETQSGVEMGVDLYVGSALGVHVTRFDQRATGLIQEVALARDSAVVYNAPVGPGETGAEPALRFALQNVGIIANNGWELQTSFRSGRARVTGTVATVDARVLQLAPAYTGDLRVSDRILGVPAGTAGLSATWTERRWHGVVSAARAWDWINYDRLALAQDMASGAVPAREFTGLRLRRYWRDYDGSVRLGASVERALPRGFALTVAGDNLLNRQVGEPDNLSVTTGRTMSLGLRARF